MTEEEGSAAARRAWLGPTLLAAVVRLLVAPWAEDQYGDAPVRLELVARWVQHPGVWWDYGQVFQYGPLPTHLGGLAALCGLGPLWGPRLVSLTAGVISVALVARLAGRFAGPSAALAAGLAFALSPLHIQSSTTFASEAIYLAFALACLLRAFARDPFGCALWAFCASTTRYDAWLWLPLLGLWWLWKGLPERRGRALLAAAMLGLGPASILLANQLALGNALAPAEHISHEHVQLARAAQDYWGVVPWRLGMSVYWPFALLAVLTPGFGLVLLASLWRTVRARSEALVSQVLGLSAPLVYVTKSVVLGAFWPMARFAMGPAALLAAGMPQLSRRALVWCTAIAVVSDVGLVALDRDLPYLGLIASATSPVSRIPADLRAAADALTRGPQPALLERVASYDDILVAYRAGVDRWNSENLPEGTVPRRIVALEGGDLLAPLEATGRAYGHRYRLAGRQGRASWWDLAE